jgi:hypothetical protein
VGGDDIALRPEPGTAGVVATPLGSSIAFIDETAVTMALPTIQEALEASAIDTQWRTRLSRSSQSTASFSESSTTSTRSGLQLRGLPEPW